MPISIYNVHRVSIDITLELDVESDFNPRDINWDKVFDLSGNESVESYIEELDIPYAW